MKITDAMRRGLMTEDHDAEEVVAPEDAAIIFAPNGAPRILIPNSEDEERVSDGAMWALRCAIFIRTPELVRKVEKEMNRLRREEKHRGHDRKGN